MVVITTPIAVERQKCVAQKKGTSVILLAIITVREKYLPDDLSERVVWIKNYALRLNAHTGTIVAITPGMIAQAAADAAYYEYLIDYNEGTDTFTKELTNHIEKVSFSPAGTPTEATPALSLPAPVTVVPPGIFTRVAKAVEAIKADGNYTDTIGADLGIIGAESSVDTDTVKPDIKGKLVDGFPKIKSPVKQIQVYDVYVDYHDGQGMRFKEKVTTGQGFHDTTPLPPDMESRVQDYQTRYVLKDKEVGLPSKKVSITVTKLPTV